MSCEVMGNSVVKSNMKKVNGELNVKYISDRVDDNRRLNRLITGLNRVNTGLQKIHKLNELNNTPDKFMMGKTNVAVNVFQLSKPSESKSSFRVTFVT